MNDNIDIGIPDSDVSHSWDSTLNSLFDSNCPPNPCVASTASERACAASHLCIWRNIASIKQSKLMRSLLHDSSGTPCSLREDLHDITKWLYSLRTIVPDFNSGSFFEDLLRKTPDKNVSKANSTSTAAHSINNVTSSSSNNTKQSIRKDSEEQDYFLVMEDDLAVSSEYSGKLQSLITRLMKRLPIDVDILYLKGIVPKSSQHLKSTVLNKHFMEVNYIWTLKAYVLRESAVVTLLANLPIAGPVGNFVASLIYSRQLKVSHKLPCIISATHHV